MNKSPFFSIIIPIYNRLEYLDNLIKSILDQSFKNFEIIISDDGSLEDIKTFISKYDNECNIIYIKCEHLGGPARARNHALKISRGKYICFLDSDDLWNQNKLEICFEYIKNINPDLIFHEMYFKNNRNLKLETDSLYIDSNKQIYSIPKCEDVKNLFFQQIILGNKISISSVLISNKFIKKNIFFNESKDMIGMEDYLFLLEIIVNTNKFKAIHKPLGFYSISNDSLSLNLTSNYFHREMIILNQIIKIIEINNYNDKLLHIYLILRKFILFLIINSKLSYKNPKFFMKLLNISSKIFLLSKL